MAFKLESPAFRDGEPIPDKHVRKGANISPPLVWTDAPSGTKSFLLIVEDPDAPSGTFRHWGIYNIPAERRQLGESTANGVKTEDLDHAVNDFGNACYDGPQPPKGHGVHHYHFRLAALDVAALDCEETATVADLIERARPHIIEEAELVGTYETR